MSEQMSMSSILSGGSESGAVSGAGDAGSVGADSVPEQPAEKVEESASTAQADADGASQESDPEDSGDDKHPVPRKALIEERKKRQESERRNAELLGQLSVYQQQTQGKQQRQEPQVKQITDEDFYVNPLGVIDQKIKPITERFDQSLREARLGMSVEMMRSAHSDYDEAEAIFAKAARGNPALIAQLQAAPNPARFAYEYGKTLKEFQGVGSIEDLKKKIEADVRAKVEAEYKKNGALASAAQASTSHAGVRSSGGASTQVVSGDIPMSEILKRAS